MSRVDTAGPAALQPGRPPSPSRVSCCPGRPDSHQQALSMPLEKTGLAEGERSGPFLQSTAHILTPTLQGDSLLLSEEASMDSRVTLVLGRRCSEGTEASTATHSHWAPGRMSQLRR